jgi:putative sterol carrier protein
VESWTIRFDPTSILLDQGAEPQAVVRLRLVDVVRLLTGQADGALLYLAGVLEVVGDEAWVLELGSALRAPGSTRALIDPAALDPEAVSAAIAGAPIEHLAAVMAGGFRRLVLTEVFGRFPEFLIPEKALRTRVAIAFSIGGRTDGGIDRFVVRIDAGECTVITDASSDEPVDATLLLEGHEFLRLVLGHLNPVRGVLSGQIRVHGPVLKALGFNAVMRIPGS